MSNEKIIFPYEIKDVDPDTNADLLEYFHGERTGFVQVGSEKYFFPHKYKQEAKAYYNFQARPDDVWVVSFPRSGTTWTQELVWLLANNLDFDTAKNRPLTERFPFFEFPLFVHAEVKKELLTENADKPEHCEFIEKISCPGYESLDKLETNKRRFIKSHFPFSLLPPSVMKQQCKIIYVDRNPKDVAVSYYHLNRLFRTQGYVGNFPRYWNYFERSLNPWMPYYSHIKEAYAHKNCKNVLFLHYEDMIKDLRSAIKEVATFLDCTPNEEGLENLINHLSISNFRLNSSVNCHDLEVVGILNKGENGFVRKGGRDSREEYNTNLGLLEQVNKWITTNDMKLQCKEKSF